MVPWWTLLIVSGLLSLVFATAILWLKAQSQQMVTRMLSQWESLAQLQGSMMKDQALAWARANLHAQKEAAALADKAMALAATADPLAFQSVQAMASPSTDYDDAGYDPSDSAEVDRIKARNTNLAQEGDLNGIEQEALNDLFGGPGDTEFWAVSESDPIAGRG